MRVLSQLASKVGKIVTRRADQVCEIDAFHWKRRVDWRVEAGATRAQALIDFSDLPEL